MKYLKELLEHFAITGNIAELGTFEGEGSTPILMEHVHKNGGIFYSFDLFPDEEVYQKVRTKLDFPNAHTIRGYSVEAGLAFHDKLDFLFIDGDHGFPRTASDGRQSGVALDILAWHPRLNIGGILAFHDYTGNEKEYGLPSLMAVEHAVDSLCRSPVYEYVGSQGSILAFRKLRDDVLYPMHVHKAPSASIRHSWDRLQQEQEQYTKYLVFGTGETSFQVLNILLELHGPELDVMFTSSFTTDAGTIWGSYPLHPFNKELTKERILVLGTILEKEVWSFIADTGVEQKACYGFYEFISWCHIGRYGYF